MVLNMNSKLIVSLDFELFWGMLDRCSLDDYKENIIGARIAIPKLLELFKKYDIHATWATVGMIFGDNEEDVKRYFSKSDYYPAYVNDKLSCYNYFDTKTIESNRDCFFGNDLIETIVEYDGQEIGSHTFSHYYCKEKGQTFTQFDADLKSARRIAEVNGIQLQSIVFPRNQSNSEYNEIIKSNGFICYRGEESDWIHKKVKFTPLKRILRLIDVYIPLTGQGGYIPIEENGLVNIYGSRMYKPYFKYLGFLEFLKIRRIKKQMLHAAKNNLVFHLWWHPHNIGIMTDFHLKQLESIFKYYSRLKSKYEMESLNMTELATEVLKNR